MKKFTTYTGSTLLVLVYSSYCFSQHEIPIDSSLKNNSDKWNVKIKQKGFTGNKPSAVSFGPVKTVDTDAGRAKRIGKEREVDLLWKTVTTRKSKESNMIITYNEADTISLHMLVVTEDVSHGRNAIGEILNVSKDETYKSSSLAEEIIMRSRHDSLLWRFTRTDSSGLPSNYSGILQQGPDSFRIISVDNLSDSKGRKNMFALPAAGFIILYNGKQVAALQIMTKQNVWLIKELDESKKKVLTSLISALFATTKLNYGNNFTGN